MAEEKILVIDDDTSIRQACVEFLSAQNYTVSSAETGEEGIELLKKNKYNIVITDLKMPGIGGLEVLKHVKENYPNTEVIIITAYGTIENAVEAMKLGAYNYLTKTFNLDEFELLIKRCLEKQKLVTEISELKKMVNLYEVSKAMGSIMSLDQLLEFIVKLSCDTLSANGGSIMLLDPKTGELAVKAAVGLRKNVVIEKKVSMGERISGYSAKKEKPIKVHGSLKDDPRFKSLEEYDKDIKSGITAPLLRKGKLLGVINLHRREKDTEFTQRDIDLLSIFGAQAGIAIENSYLFEDLQQEKEKLEVIFEDMHDGAVITDDELNVLMINKSARKLLNIIGEDWLGKKFVGLLHDFKPSIDWSDIGKRRKGITNFELVREEGKTLSLSVTITRITAQERELQRYVMIFRDITDEKRENMLKKNFLSLMSHKLKTPLTTIIGYIPTLIKKFDKLDSPTKKVLVSIEKEGYLLSSLLDKLLRFTLLESESSELNKEKVSLDSIINSTLKGLKPTIAISGTKVKVPPQLPSVFADRIRIQEVIENLIENAIKFNNKKEKIIEISARKLDDNFVQVAVKDNGPGIPSEEQEKIFQKFYQIEEYFTGQIEGVGLGLSLVKYIVESHGGKVWVESKLGEGSTFFLTIPV